MENPNLKWMMTGGTPILGNLQMVNNMVDIYIYNDILSIMRHYDIWYTYIYIYMYISCHFFKSTAAQSVMPHTRLPELSLMKEVKEEPKDQREAVGSLIC